MPFLLTTSKRLIAVAAIALVTSAGAAADDNLEARLKAAYIYNFAKFVEWPRNGGSVNICVYYDQAMETALGQSLSGKQVSGKPVVVENVSSISSNLDCHILVVGDHTNRDDVLQGISLLASAPVLTVSDRESFVEDGGAVRFKLVDKKLRFEISLGATQRAGLKVSSKLLRVADVIPAE